MKIENPGALLAAIDRDQAFGVNPRSSRLWTYAPPHLKHDYAFCRIDSDSFWSTLRRWIEYEARCRAGRNA
jgi:hypothetical protein